MACLSTTVRPPGAGPYRKFGHGMPARRCGRQDLLGRIGRYWDGAARRLGSKAAAVVSRYHQAGQRRWRHQRRVLTATVWRPCTSHHQPRANTAEEIKYSVAAVEEECHASMPLPPPSSRYRVPYLPCRQFRCHGPGSLGRNIAPPIGQLTLSALRLASALGR